ncbi:MAG: SDR family oxidoreductase [Sciscionella sp.]|nr:SDR family oxidoreductase [Sciscionella sp.]
MGVLSLLSGKQSVAGKVVVVTGAARGIGAGVAKRLASQGAKLALVGLEADELHKVAAECGREAGAWEADVTDWDQLATAFAAVIERYGRIDVLVANAGIASAGFIRSVDPAAFEKVVEVDLLGVWRTVRTALPHLIDAKGYCLIVSSMAAVAHLPGMGSYAAAKAGVEAFGNVLRAEVAHLGVDVGVAHPTWIATDMVNSANEHPVFGQFRSAALGPLSKTYPLSFAVDELVDGIARRSRTVHIPSSLLVLKLFRALLPPIVELGARRIMPRADTAALADIAERGAAASSAPVGPGGAAAGVTRNNGKKSLRGKENGTAGKKENNTASKPA